MDKKTRASPATTPKKSPDTKTKSKNASPNVKTGGKTTGGLTPVKKTPATAHQSTDAQKDKYPEFHYLVPQTFYQFGLASNRESAYTKPNIVDGLVKPKKMFHEARLPFDGKTTTLVSIEARNRNKDKVYIPSGRRWVFLRDGKLHFFTNTGNKNEVTPRSQAVTLTSADEGSNGADYYWIKCSSLKAYFEDISMEINILNTLSQDPEGHRFFPRVLFYSHWNYKKETRLLFGCSFFEKSLEEWLMPRAHINLHFIRCIMKQLLEAVLVLRKYGISTVKLEPHSIRMKDNSQRNVEIVVTNFNHATTIDNSSAITPINPYTPIDYILKLVEKKERWGEWSVAAIAYRMLVGHPISQKIPKLAEEFADTLIFGAYEFLGPLQINEKEMNPRIMYWYEMNNGKLDLQAEWKQKKDKYLEAKHIAIQNLPRSFAKLREIRKDTYTLDQKKDLNLLVNVIENMYCYDPNARTEAGKMLNDPFFKLKDNKCDFWYNVDAQDVYYQDTQVIARLSLQSTSNEAGH